jgi:hypothetical protein
MEVILLTLRLNSGQALSPLPQGARRWYSSLVVLAATVMGRYEVRSPEVFRIPATRNRYWSIKESEEG